MRPAKLISLSAAAAAVFAATGARAEETTLSPPPEVGQRAFGVLARAGVDGAYGGFRAGGSRFGVEATGGYSPVIALEKGSEPWWPYDHAQYFTTWQANGEIYAFPWRPSPRTQLGFDAHYAYNSLLLNGVGASFRLDLAISKAVVGGVRIGGTWFPVGADRVLSHSPSSFELNSKLTTSMVGAASFELVWFPM